MFPVGAMLLMDVQTEGDPPSLLHLDLFDSYVAPFATCLSRDADKRCVLLGLCSVSALCELLACLLLVHQRCRYGPESPGGAVIFLYRLVGNLCSTVGAILSSQLHTQVMMGAFFTVVDTVNVVSSYLSVLLCWNTKKGRRLRVLRWRQRQRLLTVCLLMVVTGSFLKVNQAERPVNGRRLMHVSGLSALDNSELLGYVLGSISFFIVCTSRFPVICAVYRGQMLTGVVMSSRLLCSLAGVVYAAAILLSDTQRGFLLRVMPWLLSAICGAIMDLLIPVLHRCSRGRRQKLINISPDTVALLAGLDIGTEENVVLKKHRKIQSKTRNAPKRSETDRYMDVSIHPGGTQGKGGPPESMVNKVDNLPDSSCGSTTDSSDLEVLLHVQKGKGELMDTIQATEDVIQPQTKAIGVSPNNCRLMPFTRQEKANALSPVVGF